MPLIQDIGKDKQIYSITLRHKEKSTNEEKSLNKVIKIDETKIQSHLDTMVPFTLDKHTAPDSSSSGNYN